MATLPLRQPPRAEFQRLETLWFQITGTLCNLRCTHCFISCAPDNHTLEIMKTEEVLRYLDQARELGVKEIYYTGGEPFIHKNFFQILEYTLRFFPASILTNGLLIDEGRAERLAQLSADSPYTLEIRISLDNYDEQKNDSVRGRGTYQKILAAYKRLYDHGFLPILTVTEIEEYYDPEASQVGRYDKYVQLLRSLGVQQPRIKIIPVFEMGMLPSPEGPKLVSQEMMEDYDHARLQCSSSRIVADDGVYACPILVGEAPARLSRDSLQESMRPCDLYHSACMTCYVTGMTCKNY